MKDGFFLQNEALKRFGNLEGVGPDIAMHLWNVGMRSKKDIALSDPETLFIKDCALTDKAIDRCVLYVYRCVHAVCEAEMNNITIDPALHKWWNWSDKNIRKRNASSMDATR